MIATRQQVGRTVRKAPDAEPIDAEPAKDSDDSFLGVAREIVEEEGVTGLWLGIKPGLVLTVNPAITYGVFERLKNVVLAAQQATSSKLSPWTTFIIGALSKTLATVVSIFQATSLYFAHSEPGHLPIHHGESPHPSPLRR